MVNLLLSLRQFTFLREWLSGRALPCQGKCREFESRLPLHNLGSLLLGFFFLFLFATSTLLEYKLNKN